MNLNDFLGMGDGDTMTPQQASELNAALAIVSATDIPVERRSDVIDYLVTSLNMNSVLQELVPSLDALVATLQSITQESR